MITLRRVLLAVIVLGVLVVALGPVLIAVREPDDGTSLPAGVAGRMVDVGGRRVHVVERGEGSAVLLVHGFGGSTHDWEQSVLEPLARTHHVVAVDLFGHGWSERSAAFDYGWTLWADQLLGVLDALGIARASIAGQSMGGGVATVFAARHADRIDRLILVDAVYPRERREAPFVFRVLQTPVAGELALGLLAAPIPPGFDAESVARARVWYRIHGTRRGLLRFIRENRVAELAAAYPQIAAPTLIVHDTADAFVAYATMERAVPAIRDARIVTIPGGGHFPHRDTPVELVRLIDDFLH